MTRSVIKDNKKEYKEPQVNIIEIKSQVIMDLSELEESDGDSQEW